MRRPNGWGRCAAWIAAEAVFACAASVWGQVDAYGPAMPCARVEGSSGATAVEVAGGRLYVLSERSLNIYALDDPRRPRLLGSVSGLGTVRQLAVRGETAYVTARQDGFWIVDVADPRAPRVLSHFDTVEFATGLDVAGDVAFVGLRVFGVQAVDVSDRRAPRHLCARKTAESQSVFYRDGILYSGDWGTGEVTVFDATDPRQLRQIALKKLDGFGDGVCVSGQALYVATGHHAKSGPAAARDGAGHGLEIFDVSDPANPEKLSVTKFPKGYYFHAPDYWTPRVSGAECFVADTVNGLFHLDVSDPRRPKFVGRTTLPVPKGGECPDAVCSLALGDGVVYVAGLRTGLWVVTPARPVRPAAREFGRLPSLAASADDFAEAGFVSAGACPRAPVKAVALVGDTAYAACSTEGIKAFRLGEGAPAEVARVGSNECYDVRVRGDRLFAAEGLRGLAVYEVAGGGLLREVGRTALEDVRYVYAPNGTELVMATCGGATVEVLDARGAGAPRAAWRHRSRPLLYGDYGSAQLAGGRYAACAYHWGGLAVFDFSGGAPRLLFQDGDKLCSQAGGVAAFGERFMAMKGGGYTWVDPGRPVPASAWEVHALPKEALSESVGEGLPVVEGSTVAVLNRLSRRCGVYDFSDPARPRVLREYAFKNHPNAPAFWRGRLVVPGGYAGLLVEARGSAKEPLAAAGGAGKGAGGR